MSAAATSAIALTVDRLFHDAFHTARDPRSTEYMDGARAALAFRIEGKPIPRDFAPASAQDDAFHAGIAEGHAIWRRATGSSPEAPAGANSSSSAIRQQAMDIEAQATDIDILMTTIFEQFDAAPPLSSEVIDLVNKVNCFATCAARNAHLIREATSNIMGLTSAQEGGAA
jgi:hypothetical protein